MNLHFSCLLNELYSCKFHHFIPRFIQIYCSISRNVCGKSFNPLVNQTRGYNIGPKTPPRAWNSCCSIHKKYTWRHHSKSRHTTSCESKLRYDIWSTAGEWTYLFIECALNLSRISIFWRAETIHANVRREIRKRL